VLRVVYGASASSDLPDDIPTANLLKHVGFQDMSSL